MDAIDTADPKERRLRLLDWPGGPLVVALLFVSPNVALAQATCPEGRTARGECVSASLANAMRQSAVVLSQPKLSYTAFPILPTDDRGYRYPNQLIPNPAAAASTGTRPGRP
jgi:hypothetical protein